MLPKIAPTVASKRVRDLSSTGEIIVTGDLLKLGEQAEELHRNYQLAEEFYLASVAILEQKKKELESMKNKSDTPDVLTQRLKKSQAWRDKNEAKREMDKVKASYEKAQKALERAVTIAEFEQYHEKRDAGILQEEKEKEVEENEKEQDVVGVMEEEKRVEPEPMY